MTNSNIPAKKAEAETARPFILPAVFTFAFLIRFGFGLCRHQPIAPGGDAAVYLRMAEFFGQGHFVGLNHPPVFPLFLWLTYVLPAHSLTVALFVQSLLSALSVFAVYQISVWCHQPEGGLWAAAWTAIDPFTTYYAGVFLSETLFIFLLLTTVYFCVVAQKNKSIFASASAGFLLGLTVLCRGIILPCFPLFAGYLLVGKTTRWGLKSMLVGALVIGFFAPLGLWSDYIHHNTGAWVLVDSHKGETLYWGLNIQVDTANDRDRFLSGMESELLEKGIHDPVLRDTYLFHKAVDWMKMHPIEYARLMVRKLFKFWSILPHQDYFGRWVRFVSALFMISFLVATLTGVVQICKSASSIPSEIWMILALIAVYTFINMVTWTQIRYRIPIHPFLAIFAGIGTEKIVFALSRRFRRPRSPSR